MKKRLLSIAVILSVFCAMAFPAHAAPEMDTEPSSVRTYAAIGGAEIFNMGEYVEISQNRLVSENGNTTNYALDISCILPEEGTTASELFESICVQRAMIESGAAVQGSKEESGHDASGSITADLTIYYSRTSDSYASYVKLTSVSGGYTRSDRQVYVDDQSVTYGCSGRGVTQDDYYSPTSSSWSISVPSSWVSVEVLTMATYVGATYELTLRRGGNTYTWDFTIQNNLYDYGV